MKFNLYFAGSQAKEVDEYIKQLAGCRLFSYADTLKNPMDYMATAPQCKLFMDSGAFSIYHNNAVIDIDQYIEFINNTPGISVFAQLDIIPFPVLNTKTAKHSSDGSWEQYCYMMEKVTDEQRDKVIPIYHFGEPYSALERMLNTEVHGRIAPYIGVGGRHGVSSTAHEKYFDNIFDIVKKSKNPNVKIHAFGMTVLDLLEKYPFHSADSTTWLMLGVNGNIQTKQGTILVSDRQTGAPGHFNSLPLNKKLKIVEEIESRGFTLQGVASDYKERLKCNIAYYVDWAKNYQYKPVQLFKRRRLI